MNNSDKIESLDHQDISILETYALKALIKTTHSILSICLHLGPQINLQNHKADHLFLKD